jgi:hypothetical protein
MNDESKLLRPLEFYTVALPFILLMEKSGKQDTNHFVSDAARLLPYLYLKALLLEATGDEEAEVPGIVTVEEYHNIQLMVQKCLKSLDLPVFIPEDQEEEGHFTLISELLTDVYQEVKNFVTNFEMLDENDKVLLADAMRRGFSLHWGKKVLFAQMGIHRIITEESEKA